MANVSSNNLTTLYSGGGVNVRPTSAYGNANVVSLLNVGTDGGNTVTNIVATGNITIENITANGNVTADYFIGNFVGNATNANFANYANFANFSGNVTVSNQPNITSLGTLINVSATGNITSVSGVFVGNGAGLTNINGANVNTVANSNYANFSNVANIANSVSVANVVGIGNIAVINLDGSSSNVLFGNGVFAPESTSIANANYANFAGNLINGTSNINIPVANGNINFSANNNANVGIIDTNGQFFIYPTTSSTNGLRLVSFGNPTSGDVSRIVVSRARGNITTPLSVQPNDATMRFSTFAYNGAGYQTSSTSTLRAVVDSSYTANGANIPIGWQLVVNDTNGGINNQTKTHNFYSNGNVSFANAIFGNSLSVTGNIAGGNGSFTGQLNAANTVNITLDNNSTQGLLQTVYNNANIQTGQWTSWRYRGNSSTPLPALAGDEVSKFNSVIYGDSGNTYKEVFQQVTSVTENDGAGNTAGAYKVLGFGANSITQFYAKEHQFGNIALNTNATIYGNGSANFANLVTANFFSGDGYLLSNLTIGAGTQIINGNTNVSALANGNVTFDIAGVSNVIVVSNTGATVNGTMVANFFSGDGSNLTNITGANITGTVANANYAAYAGNVTIAAQPNITSLGNLLYLQVSNSADASGVIKQNSPGNIVFLTNGSNTNTYQITTVFHPNNSVNFPGDRFVRSRGNVTTPTTVASGDRILSRVGYGYNGNTNLISTSEVFTVVGTVNTDANAQWTGGQWNMTTGNPAGNTANQASLTWQNSLAFNNAGGIIITPATAPGPGQATSQLFIQGYGTSTTDLQSTNTMFFQRARGNRDAVTSVQPNDQLGQISWAAYNGTAYTGAKSGSFRVEVDSSYTTGNLIVPIQMTFRTVDTANNSIFTTILANGGVKLNSGSGGPVLQGNANGQLSFGINAANLSQGAESVAIGRNAGQNTQGTQSVALGYYAGSNSQGQYSVAIGRQAGEFSQGANSFALGYAAGQNFQGNNSIGFGWAAGYTNQGNNAIAIGAQAGFTNQANNSIILNATGGTLDQTTANTFTVKPVRNIVTGNVMFYDTSSGEISYDTLANYTGNINATSANIGNLQLNQFQEDVYAIGSTSGTITPDFNNGSIQSMTLTGSITMNSLANSIAGRSMVLVITQGGTGSYTLTSSMKFAGAYKTLSTAVGAIDIISVFYDGTTYFASLSSGYA